MVDNAIKPAIRAALRFHEIGNDTPYRISFAGKGKSGGSFGFMQGDLAAGQPDVTRTFRDAMTRAGMSAQKINDLVALLAKHQIRNPLSQADKDQVDHALQAAQDLVDAMDEQILQSVYRDLDQCDARAAAHQRVIETKAAVYMAMWINMSGPPTRLLTWLDGDDPHLARHVQPAGSVVSGDDMEDYLAATNYYVENPQNLKHLHDCAAKGMQALGVGQMPVMPMAVDMAAPGAALLGVLPPDAVLVDTVRIGAKGTDGHDYVVTIRKTGSDSGVIEFGAADAAPKHFEVSSIKSRADGTKLTCVAMLGTSVSCTLRAGRPPVADSIEITIGGWFGSTNAYTVTPADFQHLQHFIAQAGFPDIAAAAIAFAGTMDIAAAAPADATAAPGDFTQSAVRTALGEWERFDRQTYDIQGTTTHTGRKEGEDPWYKRVGDFWAYGVNDSTLDGRDNVPWSAAFVSWVMRTAGAGDRFHYSPQHSVYIARAIRDMKRNDTAAGYWCYRLRDAKPAPGDIVCWGRQAGIDYDNQNGGDYKGHCDIIVAVSDDQIEIIGGNVGNSVTRRPLRLENGFIKPVDQHGENLFGLMKCRI